jgi:hypothetical protein
VGYTGGLVGIIGVGWYEGDLPPPPESGHRTSSSSSSSSLSIILGVTWLLTGRV